jgi:hypothetical protein
MGGVPLHDQAVAGGTVGGAAAGFGIAKLLGLNDQQTAALTGGGAIIGAKIGDEQGRQLQTKYNRNAARDARVSRQIVISESAISRARIENRRLRDSLERLKSSSAAVAIAKAREERAAGQRILRQCEADLLGIDKERQRARSLKLQSDYARLSAQRDQLSSQNRLLVNTISDLRATETRLAGGR